nr:hypothetical protein [Tanacetum cinerariifolium]
MSVKYPNYVNLTSSSEEQPNEGTPLPPPGKKSLSTPQAPSKSISSKSTHYTSSPSPILEKDKQKSNKMVVQVSSDFSPYMTKETPFYFEFENEMHGGKVDLDQSMVVVVYQEMMNMIKGKGIDPGSVASTS